MFLVLCTSSDDALYLYQILNKYLKGFGRYCADTISIMKFAKGHNSVKYIVMFFDDALYSYQVS